MIISAVIISQPQSGEIQERIYDVENVWNSSDWTWIKFTNSNGDEWCGEFRGKGMSVAISQKNGLILVLTSDYLFLLNQKTGDLIESEYFPQYYDITVAPSGEFILAYFHHIDKIDKSLQNVQSLTNRMDMDNIKFKGWRGHILEITCNELEDPDNHYNLELSSVDWKIKNTYII